MPAQRYYIPQPFKQGMQLSMEGQEFHHLAHVMRTQVGQTVEIVNGTGWFGHALLERLEKKRAVFVVQEAIQYGKPSFEVILAQAIPKINRLDFIIEKGTELGMTQFWLFPSQRGERKQLTEHQIDRMQALTIAALKQCGSFYLPSLHLKPSLDKWEKKLPFPALFGDIHPDAPSGIEKLREERFQKGIIFFIGPESGFSEEEEKMLQALNVEGVKLHPHVLRTDTAAIAALCAISQQRL
ncbi:RsmE family RNA methyltransferase [Parachlamydia sp. AcF125]|uniref:RsmE family RNA methyltransferase n=1 Tax=Parachlamydia sp. AcF125 TaxID=2795736 RepID=UPI001BC97500|nr:Ribosomal RNA small subunit methyltransferase E [Parachlamydia sp. AcF125]